MSIITWVEKMLYVGFVKWHATTYKSENVDLLDVNRKAK